jgi:ribosome-binding factor A
MATGNRAERVAEEIRLVVSDLLVRQQIKDPRVWDAGLITISHVKLTGDLRQAKVFFTVYGLSRKALEGVAEGMNHAAGFVRRKVGDRVTLKFVPTIEFVVDSVYESEEKVDGVLREIARDASKPAPEE